jgi:hypothetical protein
MSEPVTDNISVNLSMENSVWQMQVNKGSRNGPGKYETINVIKTHHGDITFDIQTAGITFASNNPFCAEANVPKPTKCGGPFQVVSPGGKAKLNVQDTNTDPHPVNYAYVLNFSNGVNQLDPIINNGGNGKSPPFASPVLLVAALLLALVIGIIFAWRGGKPDPHDDS